MEKDPNALQSYEIAFLDKQEKILKSRFENVTDLVRKRKVILRNGMAYFTIDHYTSFLTKRFAKNLQEEMVQMINRYTKIQSTESERLAIMLKQIEERKILDQSKVIHFEGELLPENIDAVEQQSFPPCMSALHSKLRKTHHLKHFGRMQYGLFLKDIGLNLQNALAFWSSEFTQIITQQKFEQQYAYNIRHNYGKEGKRTDYTSYKCTKIINGSSEDCICPFKHFDKNKLRDFLRHKAPTIEDIEDVIPNTNRIGGEDPLNSCRKFFDLTHKSFTIKNNKLPIEIKEELETEMPFYSPTKYYLISRKLIEANIEKIEEMDLSEN